MRKIMWKKGFSVAMAAAVMASPISVPTVFQNTAIVKAAETSETKKVCRKIRQSLKDMCMQLLIWSMRISSTVN